MKWVLKSNYKFELSYELNYKLQGKTNKENYIFYFNQMKSVLLFFGESINLVVESPVLSVLDNQNVETKTQHDVIGHSR